MKTIITLTSIVFLFFSSDVFAAASQKPSEAKLAQFKRAMDRTLDITLNEMKPHMTSAQKRMLRQIDIKVGRRDWNIYGVHARKHGNKRTIVFPLGFGIVIHPVDEAIVFTQINGGDWDDVMDYLKYYVDAIRENMRLQQKKKPKKGYESFFTYSGYTQADYNRTINQPQYQTLLNEIKLHGYALILAHELAHHFYGHLENNTSSLEEEMEADEKAIELSLGADYNPVLGFTAFLFFAALENDSGIYDGAATHLPPICRAAQMVIVGTDIQRKDRKFMNYLKETGQYNGWIESLDELQDLLTEDADCPNL